MIRKAPIDSTPTCKYCGTKLSYTRQYKEADVFNKSLTTVRCAVCDGPERRRVHRGEPAV